MGQAEFSQAFGPWSLTLMGVGLVIGAGIFVITGQVAATQAGPAVVLSFVVAALVCLFCGLCYAEMASMVTSSGSAYAFAGEAFGRKAAWVVGWAVLAEYGFASGAIAIGWSAYLQSVLGDFGISLPPAIASSPLAFEGGAFVRTGAAINLPAVVIIVAVTLSHLVGLRESKNFNSFTIIAKMSAVGLFVAFGLAYANSANWVPFIPPAEQLPGGTTAFGWRGILAGAGMVFFAYLGFEVLGTAAQETRDPQHTVPRAILMTLAISTLLYILVALAMTGLAPYRTLASDAPITTALAAAGSELAWLKTYVGIAVAVGLWAGLWPALFAMSRLLYCLGKDGFLPERCGRVGKKSRVPEVAVLVAGAITIPIAAFMPIALLGELISTGTLIAFIAVCAAMLRLRVTQPGRTRPFRVSAGPAIAILGVLTSLLLLASMGTGAIVRVAMWQACGVLLLAVMSLVRGRNPQVN